jgi:hypothetical protein
VSSTGETLRALAPFAGAIAASPVAIGVALVILLGRRGRQQIWVYLGTWIAAIVAAATAILHLVPAATGGAGDTGRASVGHVIGVGLLMLAAFAAWRGRNVRGDHSLLGHLIAQLDTAPSAVVGAIAAVFAINPVHLALMTAGVDAIPGSAPTGLAALVVGVVFAAFSSLPLLLVAGAVVVLPNRTDSLLHGANAWLASRGDAMSAVVLTAAGVWVLLR